MTKLYSVQGEEVANYFENLYAKEDAALSDIRKRAKEKGLPDIHVASTDGLHLEVITRAIGAKKVVEIGTLAGYSGVCIARAMPKGGKLYTFEYAPEHADVARVSFEKAGVADRTQIFVGAAIENLKKIEAEGPFDLVFIDADKESYPAYLEWSAKNLRVGGTLLADNTFAWGKIADEKRAKDPAEGSMIRALREFNRLLAAHPRFRSTILPTGEGLSMAVKVE